MLDQAGPELQRDFESGIDAERTRDADAAVSRLWCVIQLTISGMAGAGIVPCIAALGRHRLLLFHQHDLQCGIQLIEQSRQRRTHDAAADQQHIDLVIHPGLLRGFHISVIHLF